jgi:hypothetical protein
MSFRVTRRSCVPKPLTFVFVASLLAMTSRIDGGRLLAMGRSEDVVADEEEELVDLDARRDSRLRIAARRHDQSVI